MDLVRVGVVDHEPGPLSHLAKMAVCVVEVPAVDEEQDKGKKGDYEDDHDEIVDLQVMSGQQESWSKWRQKMPSTMFDKIDNDNGNTWLQWCWSLPSGWMGSGGQAEEKTQLLPM